MCMSIGEDVRCVHHPSLAITTRTAAGEEAKSEADSDGDFNDHCGVWSSLFNFLEWRISLPITQRSVTIIAAKKGSAHQNLSWFEGSTPAARRKQ